MRREGGISLQVATRLSAMPMHIPMDDVFELIPDDVHLVFFEDDLGSLLCVATDTW
jgi:hypothetical protein